MVRPPAIVVALDQGGDALEIFDAVAVGSAGGALVACHQFGLLPFASGVQLPVVSDP
jgi:hypothetical protein